MFQKILQLIELYWKSITLILLILITFLSFFQLNLSLGYETSDKNYHLISYLFLSLPLGIKQPSKWAIFLITFIIYGGLIEIIQPLVNRNSEWMDFLANIIGIISGFIIGKILKKIILNQ